MLVPVLVCGMVLMAGLNAEADRTPPKTVEPVIFNDVQYVATSSVKMGYVEARDMKSVKKLWELQIYTVEYERGLEPDVQDVFITSLAINGNVLIVTNEHNEIYEVDLQTKKIAKVK
jgi:hypothetical protein